MSSQHVQLNDLLTKNGIEPKDVLVLRHRPKEPELRKILPWLAAEKPDVYNGYQQAQWVAVEKAMTRAKFVASFIGHEPRKALFIGLDRNAGWKSVSFKEFWNKGANKELKRFGMTGLTKSRSSTLWFDLKVVDFYSEWKGKLIVHWPEGLWTIESHLPPHPNPLPPGERESGHNRGNV